MFLFLCHFPVLCQTAQLEYHTVLIIVPYILVCCLMKILLIRKVSNFPPDLCYSDQFKFELANNLDLIKKENALADPNTKWELIKSTVRSTAIRFKSLQSKIWKDLVENYEKKIAKLTLEKDIEESPLLKFDLQRKIHELNAGLDSLFEEGKAMKYAANLARWYSESNKGSKYFLNKFRQNRDHPIISQLISDKGTITENTEIL